MMFRGRGLGAKQFMAFSLSIKKTKNGFLHIDLTYYQGNKMCIHTLLCVFYNQACSLNIKNGTNMYTFNRDRIFN